VETLCWNERDMLRAIQALAAVLWLQVDRVMLAGAAIAAFEAQLHA
jgi:hypothetical protein